MGVFLSDSAPDLTPSPPTLDFSTAASRDFAMLSPLLEQIFFIGDGLDDGAASQTFIAPTGATRLFLGPMDGFGWFNNSGEFEVVINSDGMAAVPAPGAALLFLTALGAISLLRRRT